MTALIPFLAGKVLDEVWSAAWHGALARVMARRAEMARNEIEAQLRKGKHWAIGEDDAAAAIFAYLRAAQEGAAKVNLRMMAEALVNAAQEPTFAPDEFRRHSEALASLSRDEVLVLAAFLRVNSETALPTMMTTDATQAMIRTWNLILNGGGVYFPQSLDVFAIAAALGRTGWVVPASSPGGLTYYTTSAFDDVARLVDFDAAKLDLGRDE